MHNTFDPLPDSPLLLFGGPYGNLEALLALLGQARDLGIPARNILCTGDLAAYCADPMAVTETVRKHKIAVVQGNCEASLGARSLDCGCGFEPGSACEVLSVQWYRFAQAALDDTARAWMRALPASIGWQWGGRRWLALHGGRTSNNRFVFASTPSAELAAELPRGADVVVAGHCGLPFTRFAGVRAWHNPGVIGLPANDGTPRVWYSTVQAAPGDVSPRPALVFGHHALDYDHHGAARKMLARGLPGDYARTLASGLWPSLDVLPAVERGETGRPLRNTTLRWPQAAAPKTDAAPSSALAPANAQE